MASAWCQRLLTAGTAVYLLVSSPWHPFFPCFVTERCLWSFRPLTSQFSSCTLGCSSPVHTGNSTGFLWGRGPFRQSRPHGHGSSLKRTGLELIKCAVPMPNDSPQILP